MEIKNFTPDKDGIDHINVYSKGLTLAGRKLTNFSESPFKHPLFGNFNSIEGFWFWYISGKQFNKLRELSGFKAKQLGVIACKNINIDDIDEKKFKLVIISAMKEKLKQNPDILQLLVETNDLPIVHYYYDYNELDLKKASVKHLKKHQWQMDELMRIRDVTIKWMKKRKIQNISNYKF